MDATRDLRHSINGWLPVIKLIGKERQGARVTRCYDEPKTPFERVMATGVISDQARAGFQAELSQRGPLGLKRRLDAEINRLWRLRTECAHTSEAAS